MAGCSGQLQRRRQQKRAAADEPSSSRDKQRQLSQELSSRADQVASQLQQLQLQNAALRQRFFILDHFAAMRDWQLQVMELFASNGELDAAAESLRSQMLGVASQWLEHRKRCCLLLMIAWHRWPFYHLVVLCRNCCCVAEHFFSVD